MNLILFMAVIGVIFLALKFPGADGPPEDMSEGIRNVHPDTILSYFEAGSRWKID